MRKIKMWHPPMAPKPEPFCELKYGEVVFEIPYTLVHYMAGWLICGMKGSCVPVNKAFGDVRMFWTGNGVPRIYCKLCQKRVGRESRGSGIKR
jgi:hypothetical protein